MAGRDIVITDQGSVIFKEEEDGGTNGVSLKGPAATADYNIILPSAVGSGTQVINATTAGSNVTLSFATPANSGMAGINVIAYGATGNGSDDDSDAINDSTSGAIKASEGSSQASGNERIIFPAGIYILNDIDDFDGASHSYWLEGAGMGASTLKQKAGEDVLIDADGARMLVFRNMTIDGNSLANAMLQANAPYIFIDNVEFTNCSKAIKITGAPKVVAITN